MKMLTKFAAASALALAATPALVVAQDAEAGVELTAGMTIYDPEGGVVGTLDAVNEDGSVVINTGTYEVPVPGNVIGASPNGPTIAVTQAQLNGIVEQRRAQAEQDRDAALVEGAAVVDAEGTTLGTVASIEGDDVVISGEMGDFTLTRDVFDAVDASLRARVLASDVASQLGVTADAEM